MTPELWQHLKGLYHAALDMPESERDRFVVEACGDDTELMKELTALLKASESKSVLDETTPFADLKRFLEPAIRPFGVGELVLGRFRIVRQLGSGGMGEVYEAIDLELGKIALKTIRTDIANNPDILIRFKREVQLARKISGPHICRIYELFVVTEPVNKGPRAFLTMEYLEGTTLADKLHQSGPLPWRDARSRALEICDGLGAIHDAGIVHRDLKSRNIMLVARNGSTRAVLMDFGLAREFTGPMTETASNFTTPGAIVGTPDYMAPEQFEGKEVSPATDVYALGVVLYEMVTGEHPFAATTPMAAAVQRGRRLKPASSLQPKLPRRWDQIIGKCLEFRAEDRFRSAGDVKYELELLQSSGIRIFAGRSTSSLRKSKLLSPLKLGLSIFLTALFIAGAVFAILHFYKPTQPFATLSIEQVTENGDISAVAISPDGKTLAEVRSDRGQNSIWIQNVETKNNVQILSPQSLSYGNLYFSQDGNKLYFTREGSENSKVFNLYSMSVFGGEPKLRAGNVSKKISLPPDEQRLAYFRVPERGNELKGSELHIVSLEDGEDNMAQKVEGYVDSATAWSPHGEVLAWSSATSDSNTRPKITLLNLNSKSMREIALPANVGHVDDLQWLPSGKELALSVLRSWSGARSPGGQIGLLSIHSGEFRQLTNDLIAHEGVTISADGRMIASLLKESNSEIGFYDAGVRNAANSVPLPQIASNLTWLDETQVLTLDPWPGSVNRHSGLFNRLEFNPPVGVHSYGLWSPPWISTVPAICRDGQLIWTASFDQRREVFIMTLHGQFVKTLLKANGGNLICDQTNNSFYYSLDTTTDPAIWRVPLSGGKPQKIISMSQLAPVAYSSDRKLAAYVLNSSERPIATIVDLDKGKVIRDIPLLNHARDTLSHFSPDDKAVAFVHFGQQGFTLVSQPIDGSPPRQITDWFKDPISDFGWSPSGKTLAIMWTHSTSDVALITDTSAKSTH